MPTGNMFIQYFGYVDRPLEEVERDLESVFDRLDAWAEGSYREGEAHCIRIGLADSRLVAKKVSLQVGNPARGEAVIRVPITWVATGTPGLFPEMIADLVLARIGEETTQVKFEGRYQPPLGVAGRLLDRAVLHRIAEASVKNLVDRVVAALAVEEGGGT